MYGEVAGLGHRAMNKERKSGGGREDVKYQRYEHLVSAQEPTSWPVEVLSSALPV